jgi:hypothetical protein
MKMFRLVVASVLIAAAGLNPNAGASAPQASASGEHDFDWEIGTWATYVRVLRNPLSGKPAQWAEYRGTSVVKPLLDRRWSFVELSVKGPAGAIEGGSLRLYNPQTGQWSLNFANARDGMLTAPVFGGFDRAGRGTFYGSDLLDGRAILVRFIITKPSPNKARFEQAYSADGGASWEDNWVAEDTRQNDGAALPYSAVDPLRLGM